MKIGNVIKSGLAIGAIAAAAGCSGGGSSPSAPRPVASAPTGSSLPSSFGKSNTSVTLSLKSRSSAKRAVVGNRKRNYISAATQGLIVSFTDSSNAVTNQGFTLQPGATATAASPASCTAADPTSGSYTCTLYFSLSGGSYTATVTAYDAPQSGTTGTPAAATGASSAIALSTDTEPVTVTANQSNNFSFTLHGIVEAFDAEPQYVGVPASPSPSASPLTTTFHALDGDFYLIDAVDASTSFYTGAQPSGPFSAASFPVTASDENTTCATPCVSLISTAPIADPTTEGIAFTYNGGGSSGDGSTANPPYYGLIGATGPAGYAGNVSANVGGTAYAATAYVVPFFAIVDQSTKNAAATDASDVSFTTPADSVNVLAVQYHLPTNSTGYTIDASACGSIASASAGTALASGYGESFTLTPGSQSGTCVVTLSDGAGDTGTINVTSTAAGAATVTVPCANPTLAPDVRAQRTISRKRSVAAGNPCATGATMLFAANYASTGGYAIGSNFALTQTYTADSYAVATDAVNKRLYVAGTGNDISAFDVGNTTPIASITTNDAYATPQLAVDPQGTLFASLEGNGQLATYNTKNLSAPPTVYQVTAGDPFAVAFDPVARLLYIASYANGNITVYANGNYTTPVQQTNGFDTPDEIAVDSVHHRLYVLENRQNAGTSPTLTYLDTTTAATAPLVRTGTVPGNFPGYDALAVDGAGNKLYVGDQFNNLVQQYDTTDYTIAPKTVITGIQPGGLAVL